ncbi:MULTISPECIES: substrate-binding domain-containing protein [unclassified Mesorhizobium]|jgi:ribose transport system substrate-binding protein|uniref:ABC transporter, periplasmic solute-binding protein n=1 Tax=Mesorhizobium plurifarium TaxID=69974 RepID=A0A090FMP3_MESPL|nr:MULTISPECIES: substrate-binding domain-containing protein [unclassified Mesorhizobium]RUU71574.1 ABC transporter substrate-binding protein [Mesorhizobium sp. M2C.T.Ca.TU.009.01.2.1]CDX45175.1 ABC transporter, periplasmic solute-binding protein [Mesorhizobium plurifarium]OHV70312.1 ABC transporter substrate-binding protein [Mesorhizobium sp. LCM 4577]RUU61002.1 ABC transporter substrate-binding protein [Mesorhizobium sp. M2C.T.Ca.TU.002.02.1.1]CDX54205.1 ABC transporter, periplasmic solute-b
MFSRKWVAAAAVGALMVAGQALAADKKVVAVSIPAADHGWTAGVVYHAQAAAKEINAAFPDVEVVVKTSPSAADQVSALEDLSASRKLDALVILPYTSEELTQPVKAIKDMGTFITVVDRGLTDASIQDLYLAGDNIAVGANTAKFMIDKLGGKGDIVVLRGIPTVIDDERIKGFQDTIKGTGIKVLDIQYAHWNSDEAFKLMQDYLAKYPHIDAVWANDDDMLLGVLEAVKQSGRTDIKLALGGNGMKDIVKKVIDGDSVTPVETPYPPSMIKTAIYMTVANLIGQAPVRGHVKLDAPLITQANAKEYYFPDSPF